MLLAESEKDLPKLIKAKKKECDLYGESINAKNQMLWSPHIVLRNETLEYVSKYKVGLWMFGRRKKVHGGKLN